MVFEVKLWVKIFFAIPYTVHLKKYVHSLRLSCFVILWHSVITLALCGFPSQRASNTYTFLDFANGALRFAVSVKKPWRIWLNKWYPHEINRIPELCVDHYSDVTMGAMASRITILPIVYFTVYSGEYHRKHQSSASLAFLRGIHQWPVNSQHKWPVTRKMVPFDDVIMMFHQ